MDGLCSTFGPIFAGFGSIFTMFQTVFTDLGVPFLGDFFYGIYTTLLGIAESASGCDFSS